MWLITLNWVESGNMHPCIDPGQFLITISHLLKEIALFSSYWFPKLWCQHIHIQLLTAREIIHQKILWQINFQIQNEFLNSSELISWLTKITVNLGLNSVFRGFTKTPIQMKFELINFIVLHQLRGSIQLRVFLSSLQLQSQPEINEARRELSI